MKFLDLLRKLGVLRSGSASGTYTSAADRPTELQMDDVFNSKKDLITKKDLGVLAGAIASSAKENPKNVGIGRKIFFWVMVVVGVFFLIGFLSSGFSFSFIVFLILWGGLIFMLKKFAFSGFYSIWMVIVVTVVIFFISLMIFPSDESGSDSSSKSGGSLSQYEGKIFDLKSQDGKLSGFAAVKVKESKDGKEYFSVMYHFKIKDNVSMNTSIACGGIPPVKGYNYVGNLLTPLSKEKSDAVGSFSQAYCNKDVWPEDLFATSGSTYDCPKPVSAGTETDTFVPSFGKTFYSFEEFQAANIYEVYDGADAWVKNENGEGCSLEDEVAVGNGRKIKSYTFELTERK